MSETGQEDQLLHSPVHERIVRGDAEVMDVYGMAQPIVAEDVELEYRAVREGVGILDFSPLLKVDIEGPNAKQLMNPAFTRDISTVRTGRIAYGAVLGEDGLMRDDSTVGVRGDDHLRVAGHPLMPPEVVPYAESVGLTATERRSELAHLNLQGPRSRDVLARLTDVDVSNAAFPYYTIKDGIRVAGVDDAYVARMGYTAELGYELIGARGLGARRLRRPDGGGGRVRHPAVGGAAIMMVRIEAGMVMGEFEYDSDGARHASAVSGGRSTSAGQPPRARRGPTPARASADRLVSGRDRTRGGRGDRRAATVHRGRRDRRNHNVDALTVPRGGARPWPDLRPDAAAPEHATVPPSRTTRSPKPKSYSIAGVRPRAHARAAAECDDGARPEVRRPLRAGPGRPEDPAQPLLAGPALQRRGLGQARHAGRVPRHEGRGRLGRGLHRGVHDRARRRRHPAGSAASSGTTATCATCRR